jgi:hypothetical protein
MQGNFILRIPNSDANAARPQVGIPTQHSGESSMKANPIPGFSGVALALMAASMAMSGPVAAGAKTTAVSDKVDLVHCSGVNQCKGHNDCKTASNACKGHGSCKGTGFVVASKVACGDIGGSVIDPGQGMSVAASTQIQCFGINACKGHNDCKTASNACKGHGGCKGQGFVDLPASTCANIGGTTG